MLGGFLGRFEKFFLSGQDFTILFLTTINKNYLDFSGHFYNISILEFERIIPKTQVMITVYDKIHLVLLNKGESRNSIP